MTSSVDPRRVCSRCGFYTTGPEALPFCCEPCGVLAEFLASQEPLGKEFEDILYGNLWELYAR